MYDFSEFFKDDATLVSQFLDRYTAHLNSEEHSLSILTGHYKHILEMFNRAFEEEEILTLFENLARHEILLSHQYVIMTNEIFCLKSMLINKMTSEHKNSSVFEFIKLFNKINNRVANIYLNEYINQLLSANSVRINSISELVDRSIIKHYESHLLWLTNLAIATRDKRVDNYPELDVNRCDFGKWLNYEAKEVVQNNSKLKSIETLHNSLHLFGEKIELYSGENESHILITYLEKCELLSLSIGTELALVDNILMNKKVTKDALTGAMNRNGLKSVFESQYEISLATNNSFVIAMCDLDHFKKVNDSFGHVAGDRILRLFVDTVKKYIRSSDIIIRYGGEEFIIILPAINKTKGSQVLEKIREEFEKSFLVIDDNDIRTTVSVGLLEIKPEQYYKKNFLNEYINIADQKLYMAKKSGRNRVEVC